MSTDRETTRIVRSWLDEGVTRLPDPILDAVLDRLPATPQRRATRWPAWRTITMNRYATIGLGAAAVVVAILIGAQLLGSPDGGGTGNQPSASADASVTAAPTATPDATPTPTPTTVALSLPGDPVHVGATIPAAGWRADPGGGVVASTLGTDPPNGAGIITFVVDDGYRVYGDPCHWSSSIPDAPSTTVEELVAALSAQAMRDASEPVAIELDGYTGSSITLHVPTDAVFADCDDGTFASWGHGAEDPSRYHQGPGQIDQLWIVDVDGHLVVIDAGHFPGTPQSVVDEIGAIVESATFGE
jgi:hypothetical protein